MVMTFINTNINEITVWLDSLEDENIDTSMVRVLCNYNYLSPFIMYGSLISYYDCPFVDLGTDDFQNTTGIGYISDTVLGQGWSSAYDSSGFMYVTFGGYSYGYNHYTD